MRPSRWRRDADTREATCPSHHQAGDAEEQRRSCQVLPEITRTRPALLSKASTGTSSPRPGGCAVVCFGCFLEGADRGRRRGHATRVLTPACVRQVCVCIVHVSQLGPEPQMESQLSVNPGFRCTTALQGLEQGTSSAQQMTAAFPASIIC